MFAIVGIKGSQVNNQVSAVLCWRAHEIHLSVPLILFNTAGPFAKPVAAIFLVQNPARAKLWIWGSICPWENFAEILPRFISNLISHVAHKRIFSDRDPFVYWLYALYAAGAGTDLGFITPRSSVRVDLK